MTMINHPDNAAAFIENEARTNWHDQTLWFVRHKRDKASSTVPEWENLRDLASGIKDHTLSHLDTYLEQFEEMATQNGIQIHWAIDAEAHNKIVHDILTARGISRVVKSKSMLTEECHLNPYLEARGVEVVDTDLGERIVQLAEDTPSHIVLPAIHLKKEEVGKVFHDKLGTDKGANDPKYLTEAARQHLRQQFLRAEAAITGVNFAIAETGGIVICTNEGNADMGVHNQTLHIACMGIEKIIPRIEHLGVFLRLLARSATGQHITSYTSHFHRPREGAELHIVLVDNGRSDQLGRPDFRNSLKCIRCGACMNTCPIYRRSGGHSYGASIPGPIGAILSPGHDLKKFSTLPFASTLCGSCSDVCPVKIDIHTQLYKWRQIISQEGHANPGKRRMMKGLGKIFGSPKIYRFSGKIMRRLMRFAPQSMMYGQKNTWGKSRDVPPSPQKSFREWYIKNRCPMENRAHILAAVKRNKPASVELPRKGVSRAYPKGDLRDAFKTIVHAIGGHAEEVPEEQIAARIAARYPDAVHTASMDPCYTGTVDLSSIQDPKSLELLDVFVCRGEPGVAENGAIWVSELNLGHRVAPFIAQHLVVLLRRDAIVADMHEAYDRIDAAEAGFGVFIAGPSKTADIEQSLVLGAHGPRSMTVFLVD